MLVHLKQIHVLNPEGVVGDGIQLVVGMEKSQHVTLRPHDFLQSLDDRGEQGGREILEHIPNQYGMELSLRVVESLVKKMFDALGIRLIGVGREALPEGLQEVFRIDSVAQTRNKVNILLRGSAKVENCEARLAANVVEELLEAPAGTGHTLRSGTVPGGK